MDIQYFKYENFYFQLFTETVTRFFLRGNKARGESMSKKSTDSKNNGLPSVALAKDGGG